MSAESPAPVDTTPTEAQRQILEESKKKLEVAQKDWTEVFDNVVRDWPA